MWKSMGRIIPYIMENKTCSKPPISFGSLWVFHIELLVYSRVSGHHGQRQGGHLKFCDWPPIGLLGLSGTPTLQIYTITNYT